MNTKKQLGSRIFSVLCCITLISFFSQPSAAPDREVFTGTIFFIPGPTVGGPGTTRMTSQTFTLTLDCTTPKDEMNRLAGILKSDGQDGLLRAITDKKCGVIQFGPNVGHDVNTVQITNTDEGERKITILFERWLHFFEVRYGTRSRDFPFTYLELFVNNQGNLEGTMIPAARVRFKEDDGTIEIINFAAFPARITGMRR